MIELKTKIVGLNKIVEMYKKRPAVVEPILQKTINASEAVFAKNTIKGVVPWKTGMLVQTFVFRSSRLRAEWLPTRKYAIFIEMGTKPHIIRAKNKKVLADKKAGIIFGKVVHHPGTKPNKFMERIVKRSNPEINILFKKATELIVEKLTK